MDEYSTRDELKRMVKDAATERASYYFPYRVKCEHETTEYNDDETVEKCEDCDATRNVDWETGDDGPWSEDEDEDQTWEPYDLKVVASVIGGKLTIDGFIMMLAGGGPNIYLDTYLNEVRGHWGSDTETWHIGASMADEINEAWSEYLDGMGLTLTS